VKLGSLCSGFGGLDLAVEAHYGATTVWHAESDKDCSKVLAHHWPTAPNLGDITQVEWSDVEPVDVLAAGYPCQPFSIAGNRDPNDDRAIFPFIANAVRVLRPRLVVLENVPGHLSQGGPSVVASLDSMGFNCSWGVVHASDALAPHKRARWFLVGTNANSGRERYGGQQNAGVVAGLGTQAEVIDGKVSTTRGQFVDRSQEVVGTPGDPKWRQFAPAVAIWEQVIGRPAPSPTLDGELSSRFVEWLMGLPEDHVCGLGLSRTAELKMLGNGVVPQQASLALRLLDQLAGVTQPGDTRQTPPLYLDTVQEAANG